MVLWNLGSCATELQNMIEDIPTAISGATLLGIIDRQRLFMERYTGQGIGSVDIAEKFQPALINLAAGTTLNAMKTIGIDSNTFRLGDLQVGAGGGQNNISSAGKFFTSEGMMEMKVLGKSTDTYNTFLENQMTIKIKYVGKHQPNEIIEVSDEKAKALLARGDYMMVEDAAAIVTSFDSKEEVKEKIKKK